MARWLVVWMVVSACSRTDDKPVAATDEPSQYEREAQAIRESFRRVLAELHADVVAGRMEQAYLRLAPILRANMSLERFVAATSQPFFKEGVTFKVRSTSESEGTAKVSAFLYGPQGTGQVEMRCTRINGAWKIAGISLDGVPVLPPP